MMEELKVSREQIHMIAQMDTLYTAYDNKVSVYLCELTDYEMTYNADDVAEIFTVPHKFFNGNRTSSVCEYCQVAAPG